MYYFSYMLQIDLKLTFMLEVWIQRLQLFNPRRILINVTRSKLFPLSMFITTPILKWIQSRNGCPWRMWPITFHKLQVMLTNDDVSAVHSMYFLILELYYLMVEEQSGRKTLVGVQKFITTNMSQDRSQIWFKLPPLHDNLVFFVSELVSRPVQDVGVAINRLGNPSKKKKKMWKIFKKKN